jgi:hypothetical protein
MRATAEYRSVSSVREEAPQVRRRQCHTPRRGGAVRPRHVHEHGAAAAGDARAGVVGNLDHQIVQVVGAPHAVAGSGGRPMERLVVAPVGGIFTPAECAIDAPGRQCGTRPRRAVGAPPQAHEAKTPAWRCAIALALVGQDARAPECNGNCMAAHKQQAAASPRRPAAHANDGKAQPPQSLIGTLRNPLAVHLTPKSCLLFWPRMFYFARGGRLQARWIDVEYAQDPDRGR